MQCDCKPCVPHVNPKDTLAELAVNRGDKLVQTLRVDAVQWQALHEHTHEMHVGQFRAA